jgi:RimJ/RimL family protein N-acetyltransferase
MVPIDLSYRVNRTLRNGASVSIRMVRPDDRDRFARALRGFDREAVYTRFFRYVTELSDDDRRRATEPDPEREVALVVTVGSDADQRIIAGGRYVAALPGGSGRNAELAFMVAQDYQGLGVAGLILKCLGEIGIKHGITQFEADVLAGNASMLRVFERSGLPMTRRRDGGVVHVTLSLVQPDK